MDFPCPKIIFRFRVLGCCFEGLIGNTLSPVVGNYAFSPPHINSPYERFWMEENPVTLFEQTASSAQEPDDIGIGKTSLKVRLAPDMERDFLERLNKFCSSKPGPSSPKFPHQIKFTPSTPIFSKNGHSVFFNLDLG